MAPSPYRGPGPCPNRASGVGTGEKVLVSCFIIAINRRIVTVPLLLRRTIAWRSALQPQFEKGEGPAGVRAVRRDLGKAKLPVKRDRRTHAGTVAIEPNPLVSPRPRFLDRALEQRPAEATTAPLRDDVEPLDFGDTRRKGL